MLLRIAAFLTSFAPIAAFAAEEAAGHAEQGGGSLPQFNVATFPSQMFWLAVLMIVVYTVVSRVVFPQIEGSVSDRETHITGMLQEAGALNEKARLTQESYEKRIAEARQNARENLTHARGVIASQLSESENAQKDKFLTHRAQFKSDYEAKKESMSVALSNEARTLAEDVVSRLLSPTGAKNRKAA